MAYREELQGAIWSAPDPWASEYETGEFLYGLVRLLKPLLVLETGTYHGDSSQRIAEALEANGSGRLISCDTNADNLEIAKMRTFRCFRTLVEYILCSGEELCSRAANVDLAFLDSGGDRAAEAIALNLSERGIVILHDARRDTLGEIVERTGWQQILIDTPRGLAILSPRRSKKAENPP